MPSTGREEYADAASHRGTAFEGAPGPSTGPAVSVTPRSRRPREGRHGLREGPREVTIVAGARARPLWSVSGCRRPSQAALDRTSRARPSCSGLLGPRRRKSSASSAHRRGSCPCARRRVPTKTARRCVSPVSDSTLGFVKGGIQGEEHGQSRGAVEQLSKLTVVEAVSSAKALEEKWGVKAALRWRCCRRRRWRRCRRAGRGEGRVHRHARPPRRQEDQRHQGGARDHRPRPQGGQGPGRRRPKAVKDGVPRPMPRSSRRSSRPRAPRSSSSRTFTGRAGLFGGRHGLLLQAERVHVNPVSASTSGPLQWMGRAALAGREFRTAAG